MKKKNSFHCKSVRMVTRQGHLSPPLLVLRLWRLFLENRENRQLKLNGIEKGQRRDPRATREEFYRVVGFY